METWTELLQHVTRTYGEATAHPDRIAFVVAQPGRTGAPEQATLQISRVDRPDAPWVIVTCEIGAFQPLSPQELLANNVRTAIGVFCTRDGLLAVRQSVPLGHLRPHDLDDIVHALAHLAIAARVRLRQLRPA